MRTIVAFLLLCSPAFAELAAPLNDAICVYRAQAPVNGGIPNEGTRTEPLNLGPTLGSDPEDPTYVTDATLGNHLLFTTGNYASAPVPVALLNGDLTLAIRCRPTASFADHGLMQIGDNLDTPTPNKCFVLHVTNTNYYMARFIGAPPNTSQIRCDSLTKISLTRTDTVVVTWGSLTNRFYLNGVQESQATINAPRAQSTGSPLRIAFAGTQLPPASRVFAVAAWNRTLSAAEVAALQTNSDWLAGGNQPPPPPPAQLKVFINTVQQAGATVSIDGVPVVPGAVDKVVEVTVP